MSNYKVTWSEKKEITIEADSKEEAEERVIEGQFNEDKIETGELINYPVARGLSN